jgi:tetratricopeptide (TPR) repeat protein
MTNAFDYDVFISYSSADEDWVRGELLARLRNKGSRVCIDYRDFRPGAPSIKEMERAVVTSAKTILVLTPNYLNSKWAEFENLMLQTLDPANQELRLIPLLKEKCDLPLRIKYMTYVDFTDAGNLDFAWSRLLNAIKPGSGDTVGAQHAASLQNAPIPRAPQYGFVARYDDEGNNLVERVVNLLNENRAVALIGGGGLGKTTLAAEIARPPSPTLPPSKRPTGEGRQVVWTSADGRADFSLGTLLDETATQLGNPDVRMLALEQKSNAVRGLLTQRVETQNSASLLVIDNFETIAAEQQKAITDFIKSLSCAVLVTSRMAVEHVERVNIGAMTETEAREFLGRWIASSKKKNALTPLIDEIAKLAERNPMVMRWIVGQLERAQRMQDVLDELSRGQGDAATRVFGRSFGLLNEDAQATLLSLALFVPSANRTALAFTAGFGDDIKRLNDALMPLADLQLLETDANNECLSVVGLTRRFTNAQLNKDANRAEYRKRFVDYFVKYAQAHAEITPKDLNALEGERENLFSAMDIAFAAEDWQSVMQVADVIAGDSQLLGMHGYWDEAIASGEQAAEAARYAGDESAVARFTGNAATIHYSRGEYDKAREIYKRVLEIKKRLNEKSGVAVYLHQLGMIAQQQGDYETAQVHYAGSLEIEKKLGNQSGIATTLHNLAAIAQQQGDYETARARYAESLEIAKKLGDQSGIASTLHNLGMIAQLQGDYETARTHYAESLEIKKKLGNQSGIAMTLHNLAAIAQQQGDYETARARYAESLEIAKKLGDQSGIANTLHNLGMIAQLQGDYETARARYAESLEIAKKLGDQSGIAISLHQLGRLTEISGNKTEAARLYREALEIFERLKLPDANVARKSLERVEGKQ